MGKRYLEESLEMPLKVILEKIQEESFHSKYFGVPSIKTPMDYWIYLEIVHEVEPDVIIEIGNKFGGTTLALAHALDHLGRGRVLGLDIDQRSVHEIVRAHPRVELYEGDAGSLFPKIKESVKNDQKVLVIEDSSHTYENTLRILRTYHPLVSKGSYFIVEDSIINHGLDCRVKYPEGGPYEAIEKFLDENRNFVADRTRERFIITWNPKGYLKRVR